MNSREQQLSVLIVDDEELIRELLIAIIEGWSFTDPSGITWSVNSIHQASNIPEARTVLAQMTIKPDLLISDRSMGTPEKGEVLIQEAAHWDKPPLVIFQSGDPANVMEDVLSTIMNEHPNLQMIMLPKPYGPRELRQTLKDIVMLSS